MSATSEPSTQPPDSSTSRVRRSGNTAALPQLPDEELQGRAFQQDEIGVRRRHATFHRFGRQMEGSDPPPPTPHASIHAWLGRKSSNRDGQFPCCLLADVERRFAMPLRDLIDEAVRESTDRGVDSDSVADLAHALEVELRAAIGEQPEQSWDALVKHAIDRVVTPIASGTSPGVSQEDELSHIVQRLGNVVSVVECTSDAPRALFAAAARWTWRRRCSSLAEELADLASGLKRILQTDARESTEVHDPGHLQSAFGTEDIDPKTMADIIESGHLTHEISESRRNRLTETLSVLDEFQRLWDTEDPKSDSAPAFQILATPQDAVDAIIAQKAKWTTFFRAVWIARLEIENKYSERVHDDLFAEFSWQGLSEEERAIVPPVLVSLDDDALARESIGTFHDLIQSNSPVKVLVEVQDPFNTARHWHPSAAASLALSTAATGGAYVLQASLENMDALTEYLPDALDWPGASLVSMYKGPEGLNPADRFTHTSSASHARVWPVVVYNPQAPTPSRRYRLEANPHAEADWPFALPPNVDETSEGWPLDDMPCTVAHHLLDQLGVEAGFLALPPQEWHEGLCPIHEYLDLDEAEVETRIPVIWAVDADDRLMQIIVRQDVVEATRHWREVWRNVQGIASPREPAVEQDRLEPEPTSEPHQAEDPARTNEITRAVIARIAAHLLGNEKEWAESVLLPATTAATSEAKPRKPQDDSQPATPGDDSGSPGVDTSAIEEAYIDTSLCTSCDECTRLNDRIFAYNENKQAYIKDAAAGPYRDLVTAAEKCPVHIIHPGKPQDPSEAGLAKLLKRAERFR